MMTSGKTYTAQLACGKIRIISLEQTKRFRKGYETVSFCDECWTKQRVVNILDWLKDEHFHA